MPSFKIIGLLVPEKIFKGFYHTWAWWPSWSCDCDHLYKLLFPFSRRGEDVEHCGPTDDNDDYEDNGRRSMGIL